MANKLSNGQEVKSRCASHLDIAIGRRIRTIRKLRNITQVDLGLALGITSQQLHKYELGINRISASRLFEVANLLAVPVLYFYEGKQKNDAVLSLSEKAESYKDNFLNWGDMLSSRETIRLLSSYYSIPDISTRKRALDLVLGLSKIQTDPQVVS